MGYLNLVGSFVYKEPLFRSKLDALAQNDAQLKTDGWAASTKLVFYQATVPTGWTQDVSQNDKALRVVGSTGGGGSGGSQALSANIPLAHTHTISSDDAHSHAVASHTHVLEVGSGSLSSAGNPLFDFFGGGPLQRIGGSGGGTTKNIIRAIFGGLTITLGTRSAHTHGGVTTSSLIDVALAYCDVIVGTKNALSGSYTDLTSQWHTGDKIDFDPFSELAANDAYLHGALIPAGTISLFAMASAPTGWTKISGADDRFLRIVSGTGGGTGGTNPISGGLPLAHTHTVTADADHTHTLPSHTHTMSSISTGSLAPMGSADQTYVQDDGSGNLVTSSDAGPSASRTIYNDSSENDGGGLTSAAGGHTHTLPSQLATVFFSYVDVIQCSKDSAGAPYAYTDMTSTFVWKGLVSKQKLNGLAQNDAYVEYHTTPVNSAMLFFMASPPSGWVKNTAHDDLGIRIVTGSSGGIVGGGTQGISQTITLNHTHTIVADGGHTHTVDHIHALSSTAHSANPPTSTPVYSLGANTLLGSGNDGSGGFKPKTPRKNVSQTPFESSLVTADAAHSHGAVTDAQLTNIQLAYIDVIWCTKS